MVIIGKPLHRLAAHYRDLAVDNVRLVDCNPHTGPPTTHRPPVATDALSCTFEAEEEGGGGTCGWKITGLGGARSNWERISGNPNIEPGGDHTGTRIPRPAHYGSWLTTQSKADDRPETDYLVGAVPLKGGTRYCFTFWYYFMQVDMDSYLGLFAAKGPLAVVSPLRSDYYEPLWTSSNAEARNWNNRSIQLDEHFRATADQFYLVFVAHSTVTTVIGLDDLLLVANSSCPNTPNLCDFEQGLCDWRLVSSSGSSDRESWTRPKHSALNDHTTDTKFGHYLVTPNVTSSSTTVTMIKPLSTVPEVVALVRPKFCLRLYYLFSGNSASVNDKSVLTISHLSPPPFINETQTVKLVDVYNEGFLGKWKMATLNDFKKGDDSFLQIGAFSGSPATKILVDDISVRAGFCQRDGNSDFENGKLTNKEIFFKQLNYYVCSFQIFAVGLSFRTFTRERKMSCGCASNLTLNF